MANKLPARTPLEWTGGYYREPVWPREPDISAVKSLAKQHLQSEIPVIEDALLEVKFFAEGLYNKLYQVSYPEHRPSYLLRVTVGVEPYYKTQSEVATITYLREHTSVPVPCIIAWQSKVQDELGYEWILMEKIDGVPLFDVWRKIPWDRKLELVDVVATFVKETQEHRFDAIGALYFRSALEQSVNNDAPATDKEASIDEKESKEEVDNQNVGQPESSVSGHLQAIQLQDPPMETTVCEHQSEYQTAITTQSQPDLLNNCRKEDFAIGPLFSSLFFGDNRPRLPSNRGPYANEIEWMNALVDFQSEWVKDPPKEGDQDYDSDFEEETPLMTALCHDFSKIAPAIFAGDRKSDNVLFHDDLSLRNILVNPDTFDITGIVDWEVVNVVPPWQASGYPNFMQSTDPFEDEEEPPIPSYEDEDDAKVLTRDRWDNRLLRQRWDDTMKGLRNDSRFEADATQRADAPQDSAKMEFLEEIPEITNGWCERAQHWLKEYEAERDGETV